MIGISHDIVPLIFFAMIAAIVIGPGYIRSYFAAQERTRLHETLRMALEKGETLPPELVASLQVAAPERQAPTSERDLRRAVVFSALGLGLCALGYGLWYGLMSVSYEAAYITGGSIAGIGAVPGLIGLAYLVLWLAKRNAPRA